MRQQRCGRRYSGVTGQILAIYEQYHRPEFIGIDPLITLRHFTKPRELEIAALIAALLSYGRVETIIRSINDLFGRMEYQPLRFIRSTDLSTKKALFRGFRHRFSGGDDMALVLQSLAALIDRYDSIENFFGSVVLTSGIRGALADFSAQIRDGVDNLDHELSRGCAFLVPSPKAGSACKRLNMYLRWMVRPDDGIDRGVWKQLSPAHLVVPVDTHIAAIAREFGMTKRRAADWRMAEEITAFLRRIDPFDPVRFDFSLCRRGVFAARKSVA